MYLYLFTYFCSTVHVLSTVLYSTVLVPPYLFSNISAVFPSFVPSYFSAVNFRRYFLLYFPPLVPPFISAICSAVIFLLNFLHHRSVVLVQFSASAALS